MAEPARTLNARRTERTPIFCCNTIHYSLFEKKTMSNENNRRRFAYPDSWEVEANAW
ncbi:hypothetical protein [Pseudoduganella buxea]|uniref:hypothetical protein n=1 Tax=Pseudoduganella buxea TaxID=1949069 RepID=UPI001479119D|nr:hypothetical protein [Pseudoduganella buxea]